MKYLGIDYGAKRVGVAVSNSEGTIAFPRMTISNDGKLLDVLKQLIADEHIESVAVGDTRAFSGHENPVTKDLERFIERLKTETTLPIIAAHEAGSSIEASRYAEKGNEHDDAAAAAIILQRYLDMQGTRE